MSGIKKTKSASPVPPFDAAGTSFLDVAHHLRKILEHQPEDFLGIAKQLQLGQRKAYALAKIDRIFRDLGVDPVRLRKIGWTKLALLSPVVTAENVESQLELAESITAHELTRLLRGRKIGPGGRVIVLYLGADEQLLFDQMLKMFGAIKHPYGWEGKEAAFVKAMKASIISQP